MFQITPPQFQVALETVWTAAEHLPPEKRMELAVDGAEFFQAKELEAQQEADRGV